MKKFTKFIHDLYKRTQNAFLRFPVSMALITVGFIFLLFTTWWTNYEESLPWLNRITLILWLVLPLFTASTLFVGRKWTLLVGAALTAILIFTTNNDMPIQNIVLLGLWGFSFYTLLFALPHWKKNENNGFWVYYERVLFILILGSVCMSILSLSLVLALQSVRILFDIDIDYRWTSTVMIFSYFFILPIFLHVGLPEKWQELERSDEHPQFFKAISYYLLTPIAVLYFGILGAYMAKILITQEWPSGQVAYPVVFLSMVVFGFYLISYPWRQFWQKWFFVALLPFLLIYFISLGMRIDQYGLTDVRYLGILLGVCLFVMALYFAFVKRQRLQMMILPFTVVSFLFAFGPWGVFELPLRCQEYRLESMLTDLGILKDGKLQKVDTDINHEMEVNISSMVYYIFERDRLTDLQGWSASDLNGEEGPTTFMNEMGLTYNPWDYVDTYMTEENLDTFNYYANQNDTYPITGFDGFSYFTEDYGPYSSPDIAISILNFHDLNKILTLSLDEKGILTISSSGTLPLTFSIADLADRLKNLNNVSGPYSVSDLMLEEGNAYMKVRLYIENLNGTYDKDTGTFQNLSMYGNLVVDFKN